MVRAVREVRIFLSSPGDLATEREAVKELILELDRSPHYSSVYKLIPYAWEDQAPKLVGPFPQETVERYLEWELIDIVICLFWLRMGTIQPYLINPETGQTYRSGTEYELLTALNRRRDCGKPAILLYRCIRLPLDPAAVDQQQRAQVDELFARFDTLQDLKGLIGTFDDVRALNVRLRDDLVRVLEKELPPLEPRNSTSSSRGNIRLQSARERRAMSLEQVAARVGVNPTMVYRWENVGDIPSPEAITALCECLGVTRDEIGFPTGIYQERTRLGLSPRDMVEALNILASRVDPRPPLTEVDYHAMEGGGVTPTTWKDALYRLFNNPAVELLRPDPEVRSAARSYDALSQARKYLRVLIDKYGQLKLPIGPAQGFALGAVFQPLKLYHPADDEQYRRFRDEIAYDDLGVERTAGAEADGVAEGDMIVDNGYAAIDTTVHLSRSPFRRIAVLGGPGSGKSTLLKHFIQDQAQHLLDALDAHGSKVVDLRSMPPMPVFVSLPDLARSGRNLREFLVTNLRDMFVDERFADELWGAIEQGRAFICLDSLDEVMVGRAELIQNINGLMHLSHEGTAWAVSSRFTEYKKGQFAYGNLTEWELLPMDRSLRKRLASRLIPELQTLLPRQLDGDPEAFLRVLERHPRIAGWGKNPLLFTLAAILYVRKGILPESRRELYLQVIDAIIELREPSLDALARQTLVETMASLAHKLFVERKGRTFSVIDLVRLLRSVQSEQGMDRQHMEEIGRRIINTGIVEVAGQSSFTFLHQTFQEYLAAYFVSQLPRDRARHEVLQLLERINEPFARQLLIELAFIAHNHDELLQGELYREVISTLQGAKEAILEPSARERQAELSAIIGVVDIILMALVDLWGNRYCASLDGGDPQNRADVELASSIAAVFERFPRAFAVQSLIGGLYKYPKKARFIGALGRIATEEAKQALLDFTQMQLAQPTDPFLFLYLVAALGEAKVAEATTILASMRDDTTIDLDVRIEAHNALLSLGARSDFDERQVYSLSRVRNGLRIRDDQGRPADWARIKRYAIWLTEHFEHPLLRPHLDEILASLEAALNHPHDLARIPVVLVLGRIGNQATFQKLLRLLEEGEASGDLAEKTLVALRQLVDSNGPDLVGSLDFTSAFRRVRDHYPYLSEDIELLNRRIDELRNE